MKFLLLTILLSGCTQKYQTYNTIQKRTFRKGTPHNPVTPLMRQGKKETQEFCAGQIFFNKNAKNITDASLPALIRYSCPGSEFLMNVRLTETWWTVLVYSRSCIELESYCPITKKKN